MDLVTYALVKGYVAKTADSLGSLKGASCTISGIEEKTDGSIITFQWTGTSGAVETTQLTVKNGLSIIDIDVNANNQLVCTFSDGSIKTTNQSINVISPTAKVEKVDNKTTITITDKNGTTSEDILDGFQYSSSATVPTNVGKIGDIVFNSNPQPNRYVGWVYTPLGWFEFGKINNVSPDIPDNALLTADGQVFTLADGSILAYSEI